MAPPWMPWATSSGGKDLVRSPVPVGVEGEGEQTVFAAHFLGDDIENLGLAAVGVDEDELLDAGRGDPFADFHENADHGLGGQRQGSREIRMFGTYADGLHRQDGNRQRWRNQFQGAVDERRADQRVRGQRQVRSMLLDRRDRQDGDRSGHVE